MKKMLLLFAILVMGVACQKQEEVALPVEVSDIELALTSIGEDLTAVVDGTPTASRIETVQMHIVFSGSTSYWWTEYADECDWTNNRPEGRYLTFRLAYSEQRAGYNFKIENGVRSLECPVSQTSFRGLDRNSPPEDYVPVFIEHFEEVTGNVVPEQNVTVTMQNDGANLVVASALEGLCNDGNVIIRINTYYWELYDSFQEHFILMWHELGHDVLNYRHNRRVTSLMHPIQWPGRYNHDMVEILAEIEGTFNTINNGQIKTNLNNGTCRYPFN